jgi:two-component system NtrC family response regulator
VLADGNSIGVENVPDLFKNGSGLNAPVKGRTLEEIEKDAIKEALRKTQGNQSRAAENLDIPRHVLIYRMKKWNIPNK